MKPLLRYSPSALLQRVRDARENITTEDFFSKPKHKKLQEMWCAAHFARGLETSALDCHIHISDSDLQTDADFELELNGARHKFQITEVQSPGRRRGDEYKGKHPGPWTDEDWSNGSAFGSDWIRAAIEKKAKQYGDLRDLHLLVYLNFPAWEQQYDDVRARTKDVASKFLSTWLLTGNLLACVHQHPAFSFTSGWHVIGESRTQ